MKKLYSVVLCVVSFSLSLTTSAQSGGTYTAQLAGDWHTTSGTPIWVNGSEPPHNCSNCLIILNVAGGGQINLNVHLALYNNSQLIVGSSTTGTTLAIANSGATDTSHSNSINLINDGTNSTIQIVKHNSSITVAPNVADAGDFDGVFTSFVSGGSVTSFKQVGYAPNGFINGAIVSSGSPSNSTLFGATTLSSTGTLPVLLSSFTAALNDGSVVNLAWTTQMELNADHFVVLRSSNAGTTWGNIGTVAAHGNSSTPLNYTFTDNNPGQGTNEYRLQMVDKDGAYAYSEVRAIRLGLITSVNVYPNPAHDYVNVTLGTSATGNVLIRLFNQGGQVLLEKSLSNASGTTVPLAVSNFPEGNYIVVVTGEDGSKQVSKLMITK
jgi:hypothetical protein